MAAAKGHRATGGTRLRVLTNWDDFESLRGPWVELVRASGAGLFASHDWLSIWSKIYGGNLAPRVFQVWRDGVLVAAAPCCVTNHRLRRFPFKTGVRCVSMLSNVETPHMRIPVAPGHADALGIILEEIARGEDVCDMCELEPLAHDEGLEVLRDCASDMSFISIWCRRGDSATVDMTGGWEAYLGSKSKISRKRIRRERRALEAVEHNWVRSTSSGGGLLDRAFEVSLKSWKASAGTSIASSGSKRALYQGLWDRFGPDGKMQITLLEIGGVDAGCLISIRFEDIVYGMKIDFVEDFAKYSPGRLMAADFLERSAAQGVREVDMLRHSPFTAGFCSDGYGLGRLQLFPRRNTAALWYEMLDRLRPLGRGWRRDRRRAKAGRKTHARNGH